MRRTAGAREEGFLFDLYAIGGSMVLWFLTDDGERLRLVDEYQPEIYLEGPAQELSACIAAMERAGDARSVGWTDERRDFWTGKPKPVFAVRLLRIESWKERLPRYAEKFPRIAWNNADLMAEQCYCYDRDLFPLMRCELTHAQGRLLSCIAKDDRWANDYSAPPLNVIELSGEGSLLGRLPHLKSLTLRNEDVHLTWDGPEGILEGLQTAIDRLDPDVILTSGGDALLFPLLFSLAERARFPLRLDREPPPRARKIHTEGRSFMSYGRVLYHAPEYALYGRMHLDRENSFTLSHNGMDGLYEVTRLSRIPMQRIGRRSIGTGITSIQLDIAWREKFLIPWKKTSPEAWKSARQLLKTDRGGLVYAPECGFYENVVELDFISMYPSIMSRFNVSPETVNCACCQNGAVPEIGYTICEKRSGLVARSLGPIIEKRIRYKAMRKAAKASGDAEEYARCDGRQDALKWMLVTCFGYLGYRNARFGRIEAHEAVSAYSREMLIRAREVCEERGWHMIHANVDCVWIVKPGFRDEEIDPLRQEIEAATNLPIALEGIYRWLAFLPSRQVKDRPVPSRYYGVFRDGSLKYRGIECRRRDMPKYVREEQLRLLQELAESAPDAAAYKEQARKLKRKVAELEKALWNREVPLEKLVLHQSLSQDPDQYRGNGPQALAARQSVAAGLNLHAGETLSYLLTGTRNDDRDRRVRLAALVDGEAAYDPAAYIRLLRRAVNTLLWPTGEELDEDNIPRPGEKRKRKEPKVEQLVMWKPKAAPVPRRIEL